LLGFGLLMVLQAISRLMCVVELHRKWRSIPELWGIDWLDLTCRIHHEFGVELTGADFERWSPQQRIALTAGQLWELVQERLTQDVYVAMGSSGWDRFVKLVSGALVVKQHRITAASRLHVDLGMTYELD
jgi:hypothetical protein